MPWAVVALAGAFSLLVLVGGVAAAIALLKDDDHRPGPAAPTDPGPMPDGPGGRWELGFQDDFDETSVDWTTWDEESHAEADAGHGNQDNDQLEWNQRDNCSVEDGVLSMTAKPDDSDSAAGIHYDWSSCLLTTIPSYSFRYGYMETRAKLPAKKGFWPAFWTWQEPGYDTWTETDAFEYYSDDPGRLHLTQHSGAGGGCTLRRLGFDPSRDFHTYGVDIHPDGTDFYVDGERVCQAEGTSTGPTNIVLTMAVYARIPPEPGTIGVTQVDYVRAWRRS